MDQEIALINLFILVILVITGALLAVTPWLMRARECFAVTVPAEAQDDPAIRRLKRLYAGIMIAVTVVLSLASAVLLVGGHFEAMTVVATGGMLGLSVLSVGLMLWCRSKVQAIKRERGWQAVGSKASAVVVEGAMPHAVSLGWQLINVPIVAATLAIGLLGYSSMPDMVPIHMGFNGEVNGWVSKSLKVILYAPLLQIFMTLCFGFSQWSIVHSKRAVAPDMPVASAYAYGLFARAQSMYLVGMGALLNLSFIAMQCSMIGVMAMGAAAAVVMAVAVVAIVGALVIAVVYGQSGARLMARVKDGAALPSDDDRFWKLGILYVNPNDPSLFVPARFGIGWTSNFGRPLSWVIVGLLVVVIIGFMVAFVMLL